MLVLELVLMLVLVLLRVLVLDIVLMLVLVLVLVLGVPMLILMLMHMSHEDSIMRAFVLLMCCQFRYVFDALCYQCTLLTAKQLKFITLFPVP